MRINGTSATQWGEIFSKVVVLRSSPRPLTYQARQAIHSELQPVPRVQFSPINPNYLDNNIADSKQSSRPMEFNKSRQTLRASHSQGKQSMETHMETGKLFRWLLLLLDNLFIACLPPPCMNNHVIIRGTFPRSEFCYWTQASLSKDTWQMISVIAKSIYPTMVVIKPSKWDAWT